MTYRIISGPMVRLCANTAVIVRVPEVEAGRPELPVIANLRPARRLLLIPALTGEQWNQLTVGIARTTSSRVVQRVAVGVAARGRPECLLRAVEVEAGIAPRRAESAVVVRSGQRPGVKGIGLIPWVVGIGFRLWSRSSHGKGGGQEGENAEA